MTRFLLAATFSVCAVVSTFAKPLLKPHDVIALVGGQDMAVAGEDGFLEIQLMRALPSYQLRFRDLAWEGDTVFEQRRDLNFPSLGEQLDKIGATVVLCQFGQMESLPQPDKGKLTDADATLNAETARFAAAYEKLIAQMTGSGMRRVVLISPRPAGGAGPSRSVDRAERFTAETRRLAKAAGVEFAEAMAPSAQFNPSLTGTDGLHLSLAGQRLFAGLVATWILGSPQEQTDHHLLPDPGDDPLLAAIRAKNRLWFHYWRPQNWAFLNGDRINQPSSRDHLDPSKRWFPAEMEQFLPLIEAREKEIDALAAKETK